MTEFEFGLLGPLMVRRDGVAVIVPPGKQRMLLAMLLLNAGEVVRLDEITDTLWSEGPPPSGPVATQNYVMRLRKALGDTGRDRIVTQPHGYLIRAGPDELDASRFEALLGAARTATRNGAWDRAAASAREALGLWRGEPLTDVDSDALTAREVPRLTELRLQALEIRIDADLHLARHVEAIAELHQLAAAHPLRERVHALLMLALYRDGRRAEALAAYAAARRVLADELGVDPGARLRDLHQQILAADPALDLAETVPAPAPGQETVAPGGHKPAVPRQLPATVRHFTGRTRELGELTDLLEQADEDSPGVVLISAIGGTAGVGKTSLAVHWAHQVAERFPDGQLFANLRGYDPSGPPALPADVARRFLNALGVPDSSVPGDPESCNSLYRSSVAGKRMLIVLDNARDSAQIRPLVPGGSGCLVLVTSRHQLAGLAAAEGAHLLTVDLLSPHDARALVARRLGRTRAGNEPQAVDELIDLCARLPIAVSIAVARAAARPAVPLSGLVAELRDTGNRLDALDAGEAGSNVRTVFSWSYQDLSTTAARMFRLLSVHAGPDISVPAAASLTGLPRDQAYRAVGELTGSHLLTEHVQGRFSCHDLLRAYAADQARALDTEAERRAAVHRLRDHYLHTGQVISRLLDPTRAAVSLTPPQPGTRPEVPGDYEQAWAWTETEQQVLLATALAAAVRSEAAAWQLLHALEPFFFRRGRWHEYAAATRAALDAARRSGDLAGQAHMHRLLGRGYALRGAFDQALMHEERAIAGFRELGDHTDEARSYLGVGLVRRRQGRYADAIGAARQAMSLYRAAGDPAGQAGTLNNISMYHTGLGSHAEALAYGQQALAGFAELGNGYGAAHTLDTLGLAYHGLGQYADAISYYQRSLAGFRAYGDRYSQSETFTHLGDTHLENGDPPAARRAWQAALDILAELDHPDAIDVRARLARLGDHASQPR